MRTRSLAMIAVSTLIALAPAAPARGDVDTGPPALRRWHAGLQSSSSWRSSFDVFDREGLPPAGVAESGRGGGLFIGRRFGDRFLAQLLVSYARHDIEGTTDKLGDVEALLTGTVLFGPERTLQPFLRGGIGGGGQVLESGAGDGNVIAFGPAAVAGGGAQLRLGGRVSLELEAVATFTNFLQVDDDTQDARWGGGDWQVRRSNWGWRAGLGFVFWF